MAQLIGELNLLPPEDHAAALLRMRAQGREPMSPFAHVAGRLRLPRALVTPHLMGRTIGPVGDRARQREVVEAARGLLLEADGPESRQDL